MMFQEILIMDKHNFEVLCFNTFKFMKQFMRSELKKVLF